MSHRLARDLSASGTAERYPLQPSDQLPPDTVTLNEIQWKKLPTYTVTLCLPTTIKHKGGGGGGGLGMRVCNDSPTYTRIDSQMNDPQKSAAKQQEVKCPRGELQAFGVTPITYANGGGHIGSCLNLPKLYLAILKYHNKFKTILTNTNCQQVIFLGTNMRHRHCYNYVLSRSCPLIF